jgi:hypothetical protein
MAGKPKDGGSDKALSLRLPHALYDRLAQAAGDGNISEEIRQRLEASFDRVADPKTQELLSKIASVARTIGTWYAPWHENPYALAIVRSAVAILLAAMGPKGEPVFQPRPDNEGWSDLLFDPKDPPETVGRMLAMIALTGYAEGKPNG